MKAPINVTVLRVFAPLLLLVGALGFITPESMALTSGATPYNVFHLVFGAVGLVALGTKELGLVRAFNVGFGLIDVYQAIASLAGLWPKAWFQWKATDDVLHVVIGLGLVAVGLLADRAERSPQKA
ncbi:MAG: hypothetical protein SFW67_13770 [Myxococcaceae bacterium]|nr:hypothetical protein [Myxococcaceae bacterium]